MLIIIHFDSYLTCVFFFELRVEAVVRALESSENYFVVIFSEDHVLLLSSQDLLHFHSAGRGDFACCTLHHTVDVAGVPTTIPCDRGRISPLLEQFFNHRITKLVREANASQKNDFSWYRLLLAHEHIILGNLPCLENRPKLDSWQKFAQAFKLDVDKPLQKSGGVLNFSPLIWAVLANNAVVVKHLINCHADVTEKSTVKKGLYFFYNRSSLFHLNLFVGHGTEGKAIFDALLAAGSDPHECMEKAFGRKFGDPTSGSIYALNVEMYKYYLSKVTPNFSSYTHWIGTTLDLGATAFGNYDIVCTSDQLGATFERKTIFGQDKISVFVGCDKEMQPVADVRYQFRKPVIFNLLLPAKISKYFVVRKSIVATINLRKTFSFVFSFCSIKDSGFVQIQR